MKTFTYSQCNNEFVLSIKKEYKQHDNDSSIKAKYNSLIGDTYIAIENIEEVLSDTDVLQELKVSIENEDTSFANTILGTSNYGNNDSCYRSYLTIDGKNVIEIRIANHYETKKTALEKSNNLSQFIYQVVLITDPPQPQQNDSITTTTTTAHLKILTKGVISKDASEEELIRLLKSIHDYLISPNSEWEISKTNNSQPINCKRNMNKRLIRLTESDLHRIVKESVNRVLREDSRDIDDDNYFGGGLPDRYFDDDAPDDDRISQKQIAQLDNIANTIADIANNTSDEAELLFQAADCICKFTSRYK